MFQPNLPFAPGHLSEAAMHRISHLPVRLEGRVDASDCEEKWWSDDPETEVPSRQQHFPPRFTVEHGDKNKTRLIQTEGFWRTLSVCFFLVLVDTSYTIFYCYTMILATAMFFH